MAETELEQVKTYLQMDADAIGRAAGRLVASDIKRAIDLLKNCQGKAIVTGVGKSGNIAQKIAATLTSTGTNAIYLHPSDALHGGIGIISEHDVAIVVSNSGETEELLSLLPFLKHRGVPIIALAGNLASTLALRAEVVLDASVEQEACPLNLAPTTSTTVALALGDALAVTLMAVKGLTPEDFALNHPGGRLGKRLMLRVSDLMHTGHNNPTIIKEATLLEVVQAISDGGLGAVNVVDGEGRLAGIITDGDVRRALESSQLSDLKRVRGAHIMTPNPVITGPGSLAFSVLRLMEDRPSQISVVPVIDENGIPLGLLRIHDIVRSGV